MEWRWPAGLFLLGLLPLSAAVYDWVLRRRQRNVVRYSSLALVRAARPPRSALRRHLPFALWLLALGSLVGALARPLATVTRPSARDRHAGLGGLTQHVHHRYRAVAPPPSTQIGVVTFASCVVLVQSPTTDQQSLQSAVEHLDTGLGTAIGSGILTALEAIEDLQAVPGPTAAAPPQPGYAPEIIVLLTDGVTTVRPANRHQVV